MLKNKIMSHRAVPICSITNWYHGFYYFMPGDPYIWLSEHELLHFQRGPEGPQPMVFNTKDASDLPEPKLGDLTGGFARSVSPDGQWVLWLPHEKSGTQRGLAATRRSDGKTVHWNVHPNRSEGFWLPDSRRWVGITSGWAGRLVNERQQYDTAFSVFSVDHSDVQTYQPIPIMDHSAYILGITSKGHLLLDNSYGGRDTPGQATPPLSLWEVSLETDPPSFSVYQVPQPQATPGLQRLRKDIHLSPNGDRLLWSALQIPQWSDLHSTPVDPYTGNLSCINIWFCSLNDRLPQFIGAWGSWQVFGDARWNPDGKRISFTRGDTLQSVSVD